MNLISWLMTLVGVAVGALAGVLLYAAWLRKEAGANLRIPHKWPLRARGVVTNDEYEVWKWLRSTFHDHAVMVKLPVLRFTIPLEKGKEKDKDKEKNERLLELLNGVYTTFTVCTLDGKVVGCVDLRGKREVSRATRELKETLLSDCGIAYTSVKASRPPTASAMRAAFLGEMPEELVQEAQETRGGDSSFHADLDAFTKQRVKAAKDAALKELNKDNQPEASRAAATRNVGFNPDGTGGIRVEKNDRFATQWEDSFIQPADTRPAKLE
ncbi:MAG: DUF2726 domain-containing protein [Polaromonas sp.]